MMRTSFLAAALTIIGFAANLQAHEPDKPRVYAHTGHFGTVVVDPAQKIGAALYTYPRFDSACNTTLKLYKEDAHHYYLTENEYPRWYWKVSKQQSYQTYCRRHRRYWTCLGYEVQLIEKKGKEESIELCFYTNRLASSAFYPARPSAGAAAKAGDDRRK